MENTAVPYGSSDQWAYAFQIKCDILEKRLEEADSENKRWRAAAADASALKAENVAMRRKLGDMASELAAFGQKGDREQYYLTLLLQCRNSLRNKTDQLNAAMTSRFDAAQLCRSALGGRPPRLPHHQIAARR